MTFTLAVLIVGMPWMLFSTPGTAQQARTTRRDLSQCSVVSKYVDLRTGATIIVKGGTPQPLALDWLMHFDKVEAGGYERQLTALVTDNHTKGLLAVSGVFDDVEVTVSWGAPPAIEESPGPVTSLQDLTTGASISTRGAPNAQKDWLAKVGEANTESDLNVLLVQNHSRGLVSAMSVFDDVRVTTVCIGG